MDIKHEGTKTLTDVGTYKPNNTNVNIQEDLNLK
jgi:hypothetical protein